MNIQRPSCALAVALIATQILGPALLWAADQRGIRVEENRRVLIAAISGEQLMLHNGGDSKALHFREAVNAGDQIVTGDRTVAEVLIGNRAVVTLGQGTTARFTAVSETQTTVQVQKGSVRVAASAVALGGQGKITVQTPTGQVQTRGGIIRVVVDAPIGSAEQLPIGAAKPYRASYSPNTLVAAVNTRGDIIQVEEGTAEVSGAGPGGGTLTVRSGQAVTMQSGQVGSISGLANQAGLRVGLLASAGHSKTPKEGLDNLVALQVDQATALGKALTGAAETGKGDSGKKDENKNVLNGATGGVTLQNLAGLKFQSVPPTSGTLTFQNSKFNVSGSLVVVESAPTEGARIDNPGQQNDQIFDPSLNAVAVNATNRSLVVTTETDNVTFGSGDGAIKGYPQYATPSTSSAFPTYVSSNDTLSCRQTTGACYALSAKSNSSGDGTQTVEFSKGVRLVDSTATWLTATNAVQVNSSNNSVATGTVENILGTPVGHNIAFNDSALVADRSILQGDLLKSIFNAQGRSDAWTRVIGPTAKLIPADSNSLVKPIVHMIDSTSTSLSAVTLDMAILEASGPIILIYGTVVGDPAKNKTIMTTNGDFASLTNSSRLSTTGSLPTDALATLNASTLMVKGNFLTLGAGTSVTASTLAYLTSQSIFQVQGALVAFNGGTLSLGACTAACQLIPTSLNDIFVPVLLTGGATLTNNTFVVAQNAYNPFPGATQQQLNDLITQTVLTVNPLCQYEWDTLPLFN
jgi:hypothetical protein